MTIAFRRLCALAFVAFAAPAFAVYNQQVYVAGGPELDTATISFESEDGQTVTVKDVTNEEDDDVVLLLVFGGDSGRAGNLVINYKDGRTQRIALPAASGGRAIRVNTATGTAVADAPGTLPPTRRFNVSVLYGYGDLGIEPISTAAVQSTADGERPLLETDDSLQVDGWGLRFGIPLEREGWQLGVLYADYSGDDDGRRLSAPAPGGGIDNAIVFQQESETYGTGFFGGLVPLETVGKLEIDGSKFGGDFSWPCGSFERVRGTLGLYYMSEDIEERRFDRFTTADVGTERRLDIERNSWLVTAGGTYTYPFNDSLSLNLSGGAIVEFYDADMKSTQTIDFFDDIEELRTDDDENSVAFGGYAGLGLTWQIGQFAVVPNFLVEAGTRSVAVEYPTSGDQVLDGREVELDNDSAVNWVASLGLSYQF